MDTGPRYVLSLDLGTATGWALSEDGVIVGSGLVDFSKGQETHGARIDKLLRWLLDFGDVHHILVELKMTQRGQKEQRSGMAAMELHYSLLAAVKLYAFWCSTKPRIEGIHPSTLKKKFSGYGHATKEQMCAAAHDRGWQHGYPGTDMDHDEADAIALQFVHGEERGYDVRIEND